MRILVDTHIAIWAIADSPDLPLRAREIILDAANDVFVSDVSAWEVAVKAVARPGVLPCDAEQFLLKCEESGYRFLPLAHEAILAYAGLDYDRVGTAHKDPFDRLLIAQAKSSSMVFITHDAALAVYGEPFVLVV